MKSTFLVLALTVSGIVCAQAPNQPTGVPYEEVTHENKNGSVTLIDGSVLEGKIRYSEYGDKHIFLYQDGKDVQIFKEMDSITSMSIDGRGTFESIYLTETAAKKALALVKERGDGYIEYQSFQSGAGVLGNKITGGNVQGEYHYYLLNERSNDIIHDKDVKKIENTIGEYIDYCPEVTQKITEKQKGYKVTLLMRDYDLLKKAISEASTTCPS